MTSRIWWTLETKPGSSVQWFCAYVTLYSERRHIKLYGSVKASKIMLIIMFLFFSLFVGLWLQPTWMRQAAALTLSSTLSSPRRNTTWRQTTHLKRFSIKPHCSSVFYTTFMAFAFVLFYPYLTTATSEEMIDDVVFFMIRMEAICNVIWWML